LFLLNSLEKCELVNINIYAFSETTLGKSGPFGAANTL